jgi:hypothetical protein
MNEKSENPDDRKIINFMSKVLEREISYDDNLVNIGLGRTGLTLFLTLMISRYNLRFEFTPNLKTVKELIDFLIRSGLYVEETERRTQNQY